MKKLLLLSAGAIIAAMPAMAQRLSAGYISWPESSELATYIGQWNGGQGTINVDGKAWEDVNFFISRVKPKTRFYNTRSQVYPNITQYSSTNPNGNDKRLIHWVPVGDENRDGAAVKLNSLADGVFDGEVFNMWSYVDHWGNWNSPYGWTPGNFADVAHKNGVAVSGVASVPWGGISASWKSGLQKMAALNSTTVGKFLHYFGQDGLGYNSEWSGYSPTSGLTTLHDGLKSYMASRNPIWEIIWYGGTNDYGNIYFDQGIGTFTSVYKSASIFHNYNWNNTSTMTSDISRSKSAGKSPFYIYAGMNVQGGEPKSGKNYTILKDYQYSIGLWGAHSVNMYWQTRYNNGGSDMAKINTYLKSVEQWFGNGSRNPAIKLPISDNRAHRPNDTWCGMSSMMSARSTLGWEISDEPFYSYFNIGNGTFFNWKGERQNNNPWHNIGVQDYQPTWHYWFAPTFCGTDVNASDVSLSASVTWDDAYVGGSCLQITGSTDTEYLHLFKTNFTVDYYQFITVRYKLLDGTGNVSLALSTALEPDVVYHDDDLVLFNKSNADVVCDKSYVAGADGWQTASFELGWDALPEDVVNDGLGMIALKFTEAENLKLLIGEISITPYDDTETPNAPQLTTSRVLTYNVKGVDAKLIWNMPNTKATGEPCYNSDVNTSMFQMWAQQQGQEPVMMGLTTSWAGFVFSAPMVPGGAQKMRFGVSAVSEDTKTTSAITWSDYLSLPTYQTVDDITINKSVIKPGEEFEVSFVDPNHASATWTIIGADGQVKATGSGVSYTCAGLDAIGSYDLKVEYGSVSKVFNSYIAISSEEVGALPEIYSLSIDGESTDGVESVSFNVNEAKKFSYTGRKADGVSSRGIDLNEKWFGVSCGEIGLNPNKSFSVAAWVKYNELPAGRSNFITIEDRIGGGWPYNNWGYFWSRITEEGKFVDTNIDTIWGWRTGSGTEGNRIFYRYDDAKIDVNAWTHVVIVFEYKEGTNEMRSAFYINGVKQLVSAWINVHKGTFEGIVGSNGDWSQLEKGFGSALGGRCGTNTYEPDYCPHAFALNNNYWICFGGSSQDIAAVKGCVDDFQIWGKAMTDEDVKLSMAGLNKRSLPADVLGYWDFEEAPMSDYGFKGAVGANSPKLNDIPMAYLTAIPSTGENDNQRIYGEATYLVGCPFITGTAYPVTTVPTWNARRGTVNGTGTGESGSADITWARPGDYSVTLTLANGHGEATREYPVVKVSDIQGIEDIITDENGFTTYTIEDALFVEFDQDGAYTVAVYSMDGALVGQKSAEIVAGQNMSIALGTPGVYLVKVVCDGKEMRTVKVIRK